tara:strand:+ start:224 stop:418 length:195 start_codon:yes stop_codon:yes gene_type:complete
MSDLYIYEKMLKTIRDRRKSIEETITYGAVADFSTFQDLRAKLGELAFLEQELKSLHNKVTEND